MTDNLDSLISSIVKTEDELAEENKHGWIKQSPPLICFQNCFSKSFANNHHNWKQVYPEYYWTTQRQRHLKAKIKQHQYKDNNELANINKQIKSCENKLSQIAKPKLITI